MRELPRSIVAGIESGQRADFVEAVAAPRPLLGIAECPIRLLPSVLMHGVECMLVVFHR